MDREARRLQVGEVLRTLRNRHGLEQKDVAGRLGVSKLTVGRWERGKGEPQLLDAAQLADLYGVSLEVLAGRVPLPPR